MTELSMESSAPSSYDPIYFARLFAIEDRHFWFRARNAVLATLIRRLIDDVTSPHLVLEIGCGTGNVLRVLESIFPSGTVIGMDLFAEGLEFARHRTQCPLVQADLHTPPFAAQFDLIGLFDVLEHLPEDVQVLQQVGGLLRPDGMLLLTLPAHPSLWSYFDEASHHCRRYERAGLMEELIRAGYRVEYLTEYMVGILPLVWLGRRLAALPGLSPNKDADDTQPLAFKELRIVPVVNDLLTWLLRQEVRLIAHGYRLPLGTSLLAVARKDG